MLPNDTLDAIIGYAWSELTNAATDGESQFRHAQLATVGSQGWPQSRTIILRHADADRREIGFHTDRRSSKAGEIEASAPVALVAYDRSRGIQVRLWGQAELHASNDQAKSAWDALYPPLRTPYRTPYTSGQPLEDPALADPTDAARNPADLDEGFQNFSFVKIAVVRLEWLHLRPAGHRRARFEWNSGWHGRWLAP
jgi:hypothetical protein